MKKRMFQVLDEMNQDDTKNKTAMVAVSGHFISGDKTKQGAKISIGAEEGALFDIAADKVIPLLILVNKEEYFKRKNEPPALSINAAAVIRGLEMKIKECQSDENEVSWGMQEGIIISKADAKNIAALLQQITIEKK
jgi:hypothetical protein